MSEFEKVDCDTLNSLIADRRFNLRRIGEIPLHEIKKLLPDFAEMFKENDTLSITETMRLSEKYQKIKQLKLRELKDLLGDECK